MIATEREYEVTKEEAERFERALAEAETQPSDRTPEMQELLKRALLSQLQDLRDEMAEYEARTERRAR